MMIQGTTGAPGTGTNDNHNRTELADAAQQFEAMLLQEMLKPMRTDNTDGAWSSDEKSSDSGEDTINGFGVEAVATAIAKSGGLGIARQVIQQVTAEHNSRQPTTTTISGLHPS
jgi:Rod binding domain-containing protein